ncbi:MAG: hypothetical protein II842_17405 [Butyrivibrio sp.]|nr:hypothetical protein [Butyrivibrio sp.]
MVRNIKRFPLIITAVAFAASILCACGSDKVSETKITVNKDGTIFNVICDGFEKDYYQLSELEDMAAKEITYYNSEYSTPRITLEESVVSEDGEVSLKISYSNYIDYSHFNQVTFFFGTVDEASSRGFSLPGDLVSPEGDKMVLDEIENLNERHVIISGDKTKIEAPYNISYVSRGVSVMDKKEADFSAVTDDAAWLLLSK